MSVTSARTNPNIMPEVSVCLRDAMNSLFDSSSSSQNSHSTALSCTTNGSNSDYDSFIDVIGLDDKNGNDNSDLIKKRKIFEDETSKLEMKQMSDASTGTKRFCSVTNSKII
ncbi:unnamed protein product [Didymodactylos carnosus]|uniref:Uncharacterized protein n=1 Tax=Didymodactylos carnosus TaxID=1234261 RepID=A0A813R658_9BILA|nr:unnamed protein product [Didymodactylos carnosus]CAF0778058.1 unnamed protein product [Didymodactylos carnosus]CAF3509947.1 unnamed protein product [Didymodactylos carnosus]CAF3560873.1 unnamed protein product [Didymodactylos carnosus]